MAVAVAVIGVGASMRIDDGRLRKADGFNSNDSISVAGDLLYFSFFAISLKSIYLYNNKSTHSPRGAPTASSRLRSPISEKVRIQWGGQSLPSLPLVCSVCTQAINAPFPLPLPLPLLLLLLLLPLPILVVFLVSKYQLQSGRHSRLRAVPVQQITFAIYNYYMIKIINI